MSDNLSHIDKIKHSFEAIQEKAPELGWSQMNAALNNQQLDKAVNLSFEEGMKMTAPAGIWENISTELNAAQVDGHVKESFESNAAAVAPFGLWSSIDAELDNVAADSKIKESFEGSFQTNVPEGIWAGISSQLNPQSGFDAQIKESFENIDVSAPMSGWDRLERQLDIDNVWNNIEKELDASNNSRLFFWRNLAAVLIVFIIAIGAFWNLNENVSVEAIEPVVNNNSRINVGDRSYSYVDDVNSNGTEIGSGYFFAKNNYQPADVTVNDVIPSLGYNGSHSTSAFNNVEVIQPIIENNTEVIASHEVHLSEGQKADYLSRMEPTEVNSIPWSSNEILSQPEFVTIDVPKKFDPSLEIGLIGGVFNSWIFDPIVVQGLKEDNLISSKFSLGNNFGVYTNYHFSPKWSASAEFHLRSRFTQTVGTYEVGRYVESTKELDYSKLAAGLTYKLDYSLLGRSSTFEVFNGLYAGVLKTSIEQKDEKIVAMNENFKKWDFGYRLRVGNKFHFNNMNFGVGIQSEVGMRDVLKSNAPVADENHISTIYQIGGYFSIGLNF